MPEPRPGPIARKLEADLLALTARITSGRDADGSARAAYRRLHPAWMQAKREKC